MTNERLEAIAQVLKKKYCTPAPNYKLMVWPSWLSLSILDQLEEHNLAHQKFYRYDYGHEDYFIHEVK